MHPYQKAWKSLGTVLSKNYLLVAFLLYLAYDEDNNPVAIKEYLPTTLAIRKENLLVPVDQARKISQLLG